jgi:hypothetical protein
MTINEKPEDKESTIIDPLMANVFTAMFKESEWTTNQVFANKDREIREWQSRFLKLFEAIETANTKVDSLRIDNELSHFAYDANTAARALDAK